MQARCSVAVPRLIGGGGGVTPSLGVHRALRQDPLGHLPSATSREIDFPSGFVLAAAAAIIVAVVTAAAASLAIATTAFLVTVFPDAAPSPVPIVTVPFRRFPDAAAVAFRLWDGGWVLKTDPPLPP